MHGEGNVPTGRYLTNYVNIISRSRQRLCSTKHLQGCFGSPCQEETRGRIGGPEYLHRAKKLAAIPGHRHNGYGEMDRSSIYGMIDRVEVFDAVEARLECEGQRARILTVNSAGSEATSPADGLPLLVTEKAARRMVDVAEGPLIVKHDDSVPDPIDDVEPRRTENRPGILIHVLITANGL